MSDKDLMDALDSERPTSWKQDEHGGEGATLIGTLVGWDRGMTEKYGEKDIAIITDSDGNTWGLWLLSQILQDEFHRTKPQIGERLGVRYIGKIQSASGNDYQKWRVEVEGRRGAAQPALYADEERNESEQIDREMASQVQRMMSEQGIETEVEVVGKTIDSIIDGIEPPYAAEPAPVQDGNGILPLQVAALNKLSEKMGVEPEDWSQLSRSEAAQLIATLQGE